MKYLILLLAVSSSSVRGAGVCPSLPIIGALSQDDAAACIESLKDKVSLQEGEIRNLDMRVQDLWEEVQTLKRKRR